MVKIHKAQELAVKGFDAAGGAAMKMILEVHSRIANNLKISTKLKNLRSYID